MADVLVLGSTNLDLVATAARLPRPGETVLGDGFVEHPGGKGLNQAVAAARSGARTHLASAVGTDDAGSRLLDVMAANGIDTGLVVTHADVATGRALIMVSRAGENSILVAAGANQRVVTPDVGPNVAVVLAQLEIPVHVVTDTFVGARSRGITTVLNPAPAAEIPDELLEACDVIVPNEHEIELLGGVEHLLSRGVGTVIVTLGRRGAEIHQRGESVVGTQAAFTVDVVDTTAAGDTFCGALAARLANKSLLTDAVEWAAAAGALATTIRGAVPSIPTADQIAALLTRHRP